MNKMNSFSTTYIHQNVHRYIRNISCYPYTWCWESGCIFMLIVPFQGTIRCFDHPSCFRHGYAHPPPHYCLFYPYSDMRPACEPRQSISMQNRKNCSTQLGTEELIKLRTFYYSIIFYTIYHIRKKRLVDEYL